MYTVLARKYRPQTFDEVIGQDPIAKTLKNAIKTGRIAHAYLFAGTRGIGKTTMARVLAKSLNCLAAKAPTIEPCCKCDSCTAINIGEDIDVVEIDGASNRGIDEVRQLRENAIYRPARCRFKIYIIDEVHMLTVPAFNALLKILEEPPSHVKFIFATTEPNKVIPTIQSRCQRFDFSNISPKLIAEQLKSILKQEKIKYDEDLVLPLAKMANGSMRDGLSLLDRLISIGTEPLTVELLEEFLGQPNSEKIYHLIGQIGDSDAAGTLAATDDLISTGLSEVQIIDSLIDYMRDLMVVKSTGAESDLLILTAEQKKRAAELAEKFDAAALIYNITALERLRWALKNSDTPRALLEASLLRFALSEHFLNVDTLLSQLQTGSSTAIKKKIVVEDAKPKTPESTFIPSPVRNFPKETANTTRKEKNSNGATEPREPPADAGAAPAYAGGKRGDEGRETRDEKQASSTEQPLPMQGQPPRTRGESTGKVSSQRKNEIISDPAVKTVLIGLDATITGIEEE